MDEVKRLLGALQAYDGPPVRLMEVCGTHTRQIFEFGIRALLPPTVTLVSGPGCPVCVTPSGYIDRAAACALRKGNVLCTFGDMMRVPGNLGTLLDARAVGGDVRVMYSPMDVLGWAAREPEKTFILAAVGFETTLPVYALLMERLTAGKVRNVRLLTALKAMLPALAWIGESLPEIDGFLGPGHVSAIIGSDAYAPLCARYHIPLAVGGFEYGQILAAIVDLLDQVRKGTFEAHNLYPGVVSPEGNARAQALISQYFIRKPSVWRGLGEIEASGYELAEPFQCFNAGSPAESEASAEPEGCLCGQVITGRATPEDCPHFGAECMPGHPLGPCMVSAEGACGVWHADRQI